MESFYADDLVSGRRNDENAPTFYQGSKECLATGGFHLRKWVSNSKFLDQIQDDRIKYEGVENVEGRVVADTETYAEATIGHLEELQETYEHKIFAILWNCKTDELLIKFDGVLESAVELNPTKRTVLRVAARLYTSLGFVSPVIALIKILLQEICARLLDWDVPLPEDLAKGWMDWLLSLRRAKYVMISRWLFAGILEEVYSCSFHGFGDAREGSLCRGVCVGAHKYWWLRATDYVLDESCTYEELYYSKTGTFVWFYTCTACLRCKGSPGSTGDIY